MLIASIQDGRKESYSQHIHFALEEYRKQESRLMPTMKRVLGESDEMVGAAVGASILWHDLGKLTSAWQKRIAEGKKLPSHAQIGAVGTWTALGNVDNPLANEAAFAVAIHHIDRGTVGSCIEEPDVLSILDGTIGLDGRIIWHPEAEDELKSMLGSIPVNGIPFELEISELDVRSMRTMARSMRTWFRGAPVRVAHVRRLRAALIHHVLRLSDLRAAVRRNNSQDGYSSWFVNRFEKGGLIW